MYISRPQEINKEELEGNSMRCGRKLAKDGEVSMGCDSEYSDTNCCTINAKYTFNNNHDTCHTSEELF